MPIIIRREESADHRAVEEMTRDVFWHFVEPEKGITHDHYAVHVLRQAVGFIPELDLVAVDTNDNSIVGHIIFTRSKLQQPTGEAVEVLTFGPLTVRKDHRGAGIGAALMEHAFAEAVRLGISRGPGRAEAVVTLGIPDYYPRFGFRRGAEFGITFAGGTFDALLARELTPGALDGVSGDLVVDPAHHLLTKEAVTAFDASFPPRAPHRPTPLSVLDGAVSPKVLAGLRAAQVTALDDITGLSQAEVEALPGATPADVTAIRTALANIGQPWGRPRTP